MDKKLFFTFHVFIMILSIWLVSMEFFSLDNGILKSYTKESGFYELGSGFLLFSFGIFLLFEGRSFFSKKIKYIIFIVGVVFVLGALEELSWGQHFLGYESIEFASKHNYQNEMNLHNFIPAWFFGLIINLSFYIFFVFIPIFAYFYRDKFLNTKYFKYKYILEYIPSLELVLVFCFGFTMQKYFILDTLTDTVALVLAFILLAIIANQKKELMFSIHLIFLVSVMGYFMLAHEVFSYKNLQYEIREFVLIYALIFWILGVVKLLKIESKRT